jgi:hypothetical protein
MRNSYRLAAIPLILTFLVISLACDSASRAGWHHAGNRHHRVRAHHHHCAVPRAHHYVSHHRYRAWPSYRHVGYRHAYCAPRFVYRPTCGVGNFYAHWGLGYTNRFVVGRVPVGGCGWGYPGSFGFGWGTVSPYVVRYQPRANFVDYHLPPVYIPAELGYGPQAVKQFMGVDRNFAMGPLTFTSYDATRDTARLVDLKPAVRTSNASTLELAATYVDFGDARFREQKFHEAVQRYKTAARTAPDFAESHIKQGLALAASGRYALGVESLRRGLQLDPDWPSRGFALDDIYADNKAAKIGHFEALARTVLADRTDAGALYLLGVLMYFDGHQERAQKLLRRAAEMMGDETVVRPFAAPEEPEMKIAALGL